MSPPKVEVGAFGAQQRGARVAAPDRVHGAGQRFGHPLVDPVLRQATTPG
jgi:hypothetical protein